MILVEILRRLMVALALVLIFGAYVLFRLCGLEKKLRGEWRQFTWTEEFLDFLDCIRRTLRGDLELV